jgi:hypothetical protein
MHRYTDGGWSGGSRVGNDRNPFRVLKRGLSKKWAPSGRGTGLVVVEPNRALLSCILGW